MRNKNQTTYPLWSDEPATQDLLAFRAVAETAADAIFDDGLDPVAIGLSGAWGSGKTSVLELIKREIEERAKFDDCKKVLVVPTQPWRYDPAVGPKESLISEVLRALSDEFDQTDPVGKSGMEAFQKLVKKVNWSKAVKMVARTTLTAQLPDLESVMGLVSDDPVSLESENSMDAFREEFENLLENPALQHLSRVVVLVDDLDRCLPDTVVETLEAIRLFLSARGMSFVIAADEDRVAEAIQLKINAATDDANDESPARLYLHKIVQTTIPLPALSRFDTEAYLLLLLAKDSVSSDEYEKLVDKCDALRVEGGSLDDLEVHSAGPLAEQLATATRLTPILYEKFRGNPRRIKRFLNDLNVRRSVATRRGFTLDADAIAKLMVLERILTSDFKQVLDWLASNQLRDKLEALEVAANGPVSSVADEEPVTQDDSLDEDAQLASGTEQKSASTDGKSNPFSDTLLRWAKLPPTLDAAEISGYLYLAASFAKIEVIDHDLPERLRDIAAGLSSSSKLDRAGITDRELSALPEQDARKLVMYLGRRTRDQPNIQGYTVNSMLRLYECQPGTRGDLISVLRAIPASDLEFSTLVMFKDLDRDTFGPVLEKWKAASSDELVDSAIQQVEKAWSDSHGN